MDACMCLVEGEGVTIILRASSVLSEIVQLGIVFIVLALKDQQAENCEIAPYIDWRLCVIVHCQERQYPGFLKSMFRIGKEEGVKGLWRGTGAALLREASYSSIRMGLYEPLKHVRMYELDNLQKFEG